MTTAVLTRPSLDDLDVHRRELTGYCYRMLGSGFDADDAVQETMVRGWRAAEHFEGRSTVRSWLFKIATNVCLDMLRARSRRAMPTDLGPSTTAAAPLAPKLPKHEWVSPIGDDRVLDPADAAVSRDTIRLAFVTALQVLPPRQRAVLILREVLRWQATEVAALLDTTVASVNSALQRARATLEQHDTTAARKIDSPSQDLLDRYVDAFQRYDVAALVALLRDDAVQTMPPYPMWLQGGDEIAAWFLGRGKGCRGSRLLPIDVNGSRGFAQYRVDPAGGHRPWSINLLETSDDRIVALHYFLDPDLFAALALPEHLDAQPQ